MMHVKFYIHETLTVARNFNEIFLSDIQNMNAADNFQKLQNYAHLKYYAQSKFFIVIFYSIHLFSIVPLKGSTCNNRLSLSEFGHFRSLSQFFIKKIQKAILN